MSEEKHTVKILKIEKITHDVRRLTIQKPYNYSFIPGQATEVSVNKPGWETKKSPFTFTCLNNSPFLEFTIKIYKERKGVTNQISKLRVGDSLIIRDVWGAINYNGPGIFIAGGAGITPFIAIFRQLKKENKIKGNNLIFSNKTEEDIILKDELEKLLDGNCTFLLTREKNKKYKNSRIDKNYIKENIKNFKQNFYICGPKQMVKDIKEYLGELGVKPESLVWEK